MDGKYFVVSSYKTINNIKNSSRYYKTNLGFSVSIDMGDDKVVSDKDRFAFAWQGSKGNSIFSSGEIGNVHFYVDHSQKDPHLICVHNFEEFIFDLDTFYIKEKGMDSFIGKMIKEVDEKFRTPKDENSSSALENIPEVLPHGNSEKLFKNPGQVRYEDVQEYLRSKNLRRI